MKPTEPKRKDFILLILLLLVAITLVTVALIPPFRSAVRDIFVSTERVVLAKSQGILSSDGTQWTVLKIQKGGQISLEIYKSNEDGHLTLATSLRLEDRKDGHFLFQGNALNLALIDVDKDGINEIVAPTYSDQMVPRLNIFRYNKETDSFDRATAPDEFQQ